MGKVKGIFASNISGRVGNVIFRKGAKANIVSQRPAAVKNPRTDLQQIQRAYIKTVASAYSVFKAICDHSFEGVAYGGPSMHYFNKVNYTGVASAELAVLKNSESVVVPVAFIMSKGSISWNSLFDKGGNIASIGEYMKTNKIASVADVTFAQLLQALSLMNGDQLTTIQVIESGRSFLSPNGLLSQRACSMRFARYILYSKDMSAKAFVVDASGEEGTYTLNPAILAEDSLMNRFAKISVIENGTISVIAPVGNESLGHSAIISRRDGDKWLRSDASLVVRAQVSNTSYEIANVLPSYRPSNEPYLNNAEK